MHRRYAIAFPLCVLLLAATGPVRAASDDRQSVEELRNTVVNLLQGLVDRGVLTREQAEQMVRSAQTRAAADAAAAAAQDEGAVRVPYVPEVVRQEIRASVKEELREEVTREVAETARQEGWGVPAALPAWVRSMRWHGDLRLRGQGDYYASGNFPESYLDFQQINEAGGIGRAGQDAFVNTSVDRNRMRARLRVGFDTTLGAGWSMGARIATGSPGDPVSTNQTLGNSGFRHPLGLDLAYLDFIAGDDTRRQSLRLTGGRLPSPFLAASDLVYDRDLTFDGVAASYRLGLRGSNPASTWLRATAGAFPMKEVELSGRDQWLIGSQLEFGWNAGGNSLRAGAALFDHRDVAGRRNDFGSSLLDYTAPEYLRQGNTVFDIRNDNDNNTQLFALAADYKLVSYSLVLDARLGSGHSARFGADYVQNIGYRESEVLARRGQAVRRRNVGYQGELSIGSASMTQPNAWRATVGYRYLQRDAVLDAFTDSDFRLGGTDTKGYYVGLDYGFTSAVMARLKFLSASEIDGPPLGVDVLQLDLTASF